MFLTTTNMLAGIQRSSRAPVPIHRPPIRSIQHYWADGFTKTPVEDDDIEILRNGGLTPAQKPHNLRADEAIKLVADAASAHDTALRATTVHNSVTPRRLAFAIFNDIDRVFFGGVLKGNVHLEIVGDAGNGAGLPLGQFGMTMRAEGDSRERVTIRLSERLLVAVEAAPLILTLIHQMIHAFLLQACGYKVPGTDRPGWRSRGHDLGHDSDFAVVAYIIDAVCNASTGQHWYSVFPANLGCFRRRDTLATLPYRHSAAGSGLWELPSAEQSSCYLEDEGVSAVRSQILLEHIEQATESPRLDVAVSAHRERSMAHYVHLYTGSSNKLKPVLRSDYAKCAPPFLELKYRGRAVPVPVALTPSLATRLASNPRAELNMEVEDDTAFTMLCAYLTTGRYAPAIEGRSGGPPRLDGGLAGGSPLVLDDVRVCRHGAALGIPEVQRHALDRLWGHASTHEDPIEALEYLYHGPAPSPTAHRCDFHAVSAAKLGPPTVALRRWARAFLKVRTDNGRGQQQQERNLGTLKSLDWSRQWTRLKQRGGLLIDDLEQVEDEIAAEAWEVHQHHQHQHQHQHHDHQQQGHERWVRVGFEDL